MGGKQQAERYTLENDRLQVEVLTKTFSIYVTDKQTGQQWRMVDEPFDEVVLERSGVVSKHTLASSQSLVARDLGDRALLFEFRDFRLRLLLALEGSEISFTLIPGEENDRFRIKGVCYPRAFELAQARDCSPPQNATMEAVSRSLTSA